MNLCPFLKLSFKACDLTNKKKLFLVVASTPDYKSMCVIDQSKNLPTAKCQEWLICEVENVSRGAKKWKELGEYKIIRLEFDYRIIKLQFKYYYFYWILSKTDFKFRKITKFLQVFQQRQVYI